MILRDSLRQAAQVLAVAGVGSPLYDARLIAADLLGCAVTSLIFHEDEETPEGFEERVARRARREPLQYILGTAPFGPLEIEVGPGVFIPRPETEALAQWAVDTLTASPTVGGSSGGSAGSGPDGNTQPQADNAQVVDLCTGSGAIAAFIAQALPSAAITVVELSDDAARYARTNLPETVTLVVGDATSPQTLEELNGTVDLITCNPPYVPTTTVVPPEVNADPALAVFAGSDGMSLIPALIERSARLLKPGGWVGIEHDDSTGEAVTQCCESHGAFSDVAQLKDLTGVNRFVIARRR